MSLNERCLVWKKGLIWAGLLGALPGGVRAQASDADDALLSILEEETAAATENRQNADFLPGILTTITGDDLVRHGATTAWDALDLVSGLHTQPNNFGELAVTVRGIGYAQHFIQFKVLIDGVAINSTGEQRMAYLLVPVEMIERLEVTRGPGGVLFGTEATAGVINIVTRRDGQGAFVERGSFDTWRGGAYTSWESSRHQLRAHLAGSLYVTDGSAATLKMDRARFTQGIGYAPGPIDDREQGAFLSGGVEWGDFSLQGRLMERKLATFYGFVSLPLRGELPMGKDQFYQVVASHRRDWTDSLHTEVELGYHRHNFNGPVTLLFPEGARPDSPPGRPPRTPAPFDILNQRSQEVEEYRESFRVQWSPGERHQLQFQIEGSQLEVLSGSSVAIQDATPPYFTPRERSFLYTGIERQSLASPCRTMSRLPITCRPHWGCATTTSPIRANTARPWRRSPGKSPRTTSSSSSTARASGRRRSSRKYERTEGVRDLQTELVQTVDLSYIYRDAQRTARLTVFTTFLNDAIERPTLSRNADLYANYDTNRAEGAELEWSEHLTNWLTLEGNVSYADTRDARHGGELGGSQHLLGNAGVDIYFTPQWCLYTHWRFVGATSPFKNDVAADKSPAYDTWNFVLSGQDWPFEGISCQLGVRNAFDKDIWYLPLPDTHPRGMPGAGRYWFAQIGYSH